MSLHSILKFSNAILGKTVAAIAATAIAVSGFAIWDNHQFYQSVNVQNQKLHEYKPDSENQTDGFDTLRQKNPDVIGWLTIPNSNIDYPIVQSDSNTYYLNRDVYRNYSMAGSIYLDNRCSNDFTDEYSMIYGHNMTEHLMFGDLNLYQNQQFFEKNTDAFIYTPDEQYDYSVLAVLKAADSTPELFFPDKTNSNEIAAYIEENAIQYSTELLHTIRGNPDRMYIVSLVTCTTGNTGERLLLLLCREGEERPQTTTTTMTVTTTSAKTTATTAVNTTSSKVTSTSDNTTATTAVTTTSEKVTSTSSLTTTTTTTVISTTTVSDNDGPGITTTVVAKSSYSIEFQGPNRVFYWSHDDRTFHDIPNGLNGMQVMMTVEKWFEDAQGNIVDENGFAAEKTVKTQNITDLCMPDIPSPKAVYATVEHTVGVFESEKHMFTVPVSFDSTKVSDPDFIIGEGDTIPVGDFKIFIGMKGDTTFDEQVSEYDATQVLKFYVSISLLGHEYYELHSDADLQSLAFFLGDVAEPMGMEDESHPEFGNARYAYFYNLTEYDATAILRYYAYVEIMGEEPGHDAWIYAAGFDFPEKLDETNP